MSVIGKYQILEQIGEGAMGVVYKAMDPVLNRTVAIKVMSEGLAQDAALRERFLREAQAAGSLQHPNLVTIYDFGETDGHLFIAMEYIEGADLESLLTQEQQMPLEAKLDLIIDVLNGLSFAHRRNIIHRDIKPANIRIDQEGRARIMDFGVAKLDKSNLTGTGVMMGTPNYMAPEQITSGNLTPAADLWSVGAVLYELLSGRKPFGADTLHRVLFRIVSEPPSEITETAPGLPAAVVAIVKKSLDKDPLKRFHTATEMANALAAVRASLGARRTSRTVSQRSSIEVQLKAAQEKAQVAAAAREGRSMTLVGVSVGVGVILAAAGIIMAGRRDKLPTSAEPAPTPSVSLTPALTPPPIATAPPSVQQQTPAQTPTQSPPPQPRPQTPTQTPRQTNLAETKRPARDTETKQGPSLQQQTPVQQVPTQTVQQAPSPPVTPLVRDSSPPQANSVAAPPPAATPAPAPVDHRPAITSIVEAYARSIGTRNVAEVRRIYAGMTPQQQSAWESFFASVRSIKASLSISNLEITGATATARLVGAYDYVSRTGRNETRPAAFEATFQREGDRWTLQSVR